MKREKQKPSFAYKKALKSKTESQDGGLGSMYSSNHWSGPTRNKKNDLQNKKDQEIWIQKQRTKMQPRTRSVRGKYQKPQISNQAGAQKWGKHRNRDPGV